MAWKKTLLSAVLVAGAAALPGASNSGASSTQSEHAIFTVPASAQNGANVLPNIKDPDAKDPQDECPGYTASNVQKNTLGVTATLSLNGDGCSVYGNDVEKLTLTVEYQAKDRLSVKIQPADISDKEQSYYILPEYLVPSPQAEDGASAESNDNDLEFGWSNDPTFQFWVTRKSTGDEIFSTKGNKLVFEDQFIEVKTSMPDNYNLYGLGETIHGLRLGTNFTKTMWAADVGDPIDYNLYGSHPIYVDTRYYEKGGYGGNNTLYTGDSPDPNTEYVSYSHGLYNRNAHGQEILMRENSVTWRTIGGSIDLYFYSGPSPTDVITSYQKSGSGLPAMQRYFAFGFHQCRWGYENWSVVRDVVENYKKFEIPLEVVWTDIDYMNQYRDFSVDDVRFGYDEGAKLLAELADNGQHYVPIVDSAIYVPNPQNKSDAYPTFDRGNDSNSFLLNPDGSLYIGAVWPGYTAFPDWLQGSGAHEWWTNEVVSWHKQLNFSGIWIDMSEVSSFCVGSCGSGNLSLNPAHPPFQLPGEKGNLQLDYPEGFNLTNQTEAASASAASSSQAAAASSGAPPAMTTSTTYVRTTPTPGVRNVNYPPYVLNNVQGDLAVHAASPNATHQDGTLEYDVHNLWGHGILNATYHALEATFPKLRPFIIGRSTFVGSGQYAGHWGGDNFSKWLYMYFSIPQALTFSIFGIPMFGVDTCGFQGNSDEELCNRWMQLSAFFPFYRNHNTLSTIPQEAYVWGSVIDASKKAMAIRYQLLPYMYTLFERAHKTGSTVMRALAWEYPNDPSLANADRQFFLGSAILVTPVLIQGATSVNGVFPGVAGGQVYYDWYTHAKVDAKAGENKTIDAPLGHIPVFIAGGNVIPMQQAALTTRDARNTPWSILAALGGDGSAKGCLYIDDGDSIEPETQKNVKFTVSNSKLCATVDGDYQDTNALANVTVLGVQSQPSSVKLNGQKVTDFSYDSSNQELVVKSLDQATSKGAWSADWTLEW